MATWRPTPRWWPPSPRAQPPAKIAAALVASAARGARRSPRPPPPAPASSTSACDPAALPRAAARHPARRRGLRRQHASAPARAINVEYVSANPTGPMHIGHCRGAVVGDALANLLAKAGYAVTKEYYINDAGAQVTALAWAAYWRYLQAHRHAADRGGLLRRSPRRPAIPRRISDPGRRGSSRASYGASLAAARPAASPRRKSGSTPCATSPSTR